MSQVSTAAFACALAVTAAALIWAAWSDVRRFLIPNRISAIIAAAYCMALLEMPVAIWVAGLATGIVTLLIGAILFAQKWVGGGDVKLAGAIGLWAGPALFADFLLMTSIVALLLGVGMLLSRLPRLVGEAGSVRETASASMPFGVPLAAGGIWVVSLHLASLS